jgi:hypothetical protein
MISKLRKIPFLHKFIAFLVLFSTVIYVEEVDNYFNKKIEKLWDLDGATKKTFSIETKNSNKKTSIPIFLSPIKPEVQEFQILPQADNTILGKYGTKVTIPANSISLPGNFRRGDIVILELIEVYDPLDIILSGIDLIYTDSKGKNFLFETGGMYKINASYYSQPLTIKKGFKLKVSVPKLPNSPENMKLFRLDPIRDAWVVLGDEEQQVLNNSSKDEIASDERYFGSIPDFEWMNFDYPNPETTCITGEIKPLIKSPPYTIMTIGVDHKFGTGKTANDSNFFMNVIKDKTIVVLVMDDKGNLGKSKAIKTDHKNIFLTDSNKSKECLDIGVLSIEKMEASIRQDKEKFKKFIGL